MNRFADVKKVFWFGLLGALGCLVGWILGEVFLLATLPAGKEAGGSLASKPVLPPLPSQAVLPTTPPPPAPPPERRATSSAAPAPPPAEFAQRLNMAGAKSGDVQITLIWFNRNDLDLHCIEPGREEVFYAHRRSRSGGELDVDMNASGPMTDRPVENIYWPKGRAPQGKYRVYVNHYANHGGRDPSEYKVSVLANGRREEFSGKISRSDPKRFICEFEVNADVPELLLAVSPELIIYQGGKNVLRFRIAAPAGFGPVGLRLEGDTSGITPREFALTANASETTAEIEAEASTLPGERIIAVTAGAGTLTANATFRLTVKEKPHELRLAVSPEVILNQGGRNTLPMRISREGFTGPVKVSLEGNMSGVSPREFTIPADQNEHEVSLSATDAATGSREINVSAAGGGVHADAALALILAPPIQTASKWSWSLDVVIGLWTALLAEGLSVALVMGQNWYLVRPYLSGREFAVLTLGSLISGVIAGGGGQVLYGLFSQARLVPEIGFVAGWLLLGGLLGRGVVYFIPNLNNRRASVAGSAGGLLGSVAFIYVSSIGDVAGRLAGAIILGFAIGLMVALVEATCRKVWLEITFGQRAGQAVNLGTTPIIIGGNATKCTILVPGAPQRALKFWENNGQVYCLDVVAEKTFPVSPGYQHRLRDALIVVCSGNQNNSGRSSPSSHLGKVENPPIRSLIRPSPMPPVPKPKQQPRSSTAERAAPAPSSKATTPDKSLSSPPVRPAQASQSIPTSAPIIKSCPVCGHRSSKGGSDKRRCNNCFTMF